jgi:hypothetical protein
VATVEELMVFGFNSERFRQPMPVIESLLNRSVSISNEEVMAARFDNQRENICIHRIIHQLVVDQGGSLKRAVRSHDFQAIFEKHTLIFFHGQLFLLDAPKLHFFLLLLRDNMIFWELELLLQGFSNDLIKIRNRPLLRNLT